MSLFRTKPVVVEAIQNKDDNQSDVSVFFGEDPDDRFGYKSGIWSIITLEGVMDAHLGDWIIKGVAGEFYPCKPDIFEQTYELVKTDAQCFELEVSNDQD